MTATTYLVFADVHANAAALEAVLTAEDDWDAVLFLGDAVDDGPEPALTVSILDELPGRFLIGNHDKHILTATGDPSAADTESERWSRWTRRQLSVEHLDFLADLEQSIRLETADVTGRLHHGDFELPDIFKNWNGRLWPDTDEAVFEYLSDRFEESVVLSAHSHVQFDRTVAGTRFINPGSVGQTRLGTVEACYAVLKGGSFRFEATGYDADRTLEAMHQLPLANEFIEARNEVYRYGRLPEFVDIRDFEPLREAGYR